PRWSGPVGRGRTSSWSANSAAASSCGDVVLLWFWGTSFLTVWLVFHDPSIDYRVLLLGSILPDLIDAPFGGAAIAHSVTFSVVTLIVVVLATIGRRAARRRWLALPIGMFLH